jgi:chaperonin GroEL (HSP60 family)
MRILVLRNRIHNTAMHICRNFISLTNKNQPAFVILFFDVVLFLQYFADRDMFCAGRVPDEDLQRTMKACGGAIQSTVHDLNDETLGTCETFEEKQVGQSNLSPFFSFIPRNLTCT